jgi:cyclopropane fatty-acyl-phospholipid synthase-like methyltransferase
VDKNELQIPLSVRLKAWWEGYDPADLMRARRHAGGEPEPEVFRLLPETHGGPEDEPVEVARYSPTHIEFLELAWGEGFVGPRSETFLVDLTKPLALGPEHTILDFGSRLGGGTRAIARAYGVWIEGLEPNAVLATHGMSLSVKAGLGERAPILPCDPEEPEITENRYNAIVSMEALHAIKEKERLFEALEKGLKLKGQLLFTDFLLTDAKSVDPTVKVWIEHEPGGVYLWSVKKTVKALTELGLDARIREDITDHYKRHIIAEWAELLDRMKKVRLPRRLQYYLLAEMELAQLRMAALESGSLGLYRFHAFKDVGMLFGT